MILVRLDDNIDSHLGLRKNRGTIDKNLIVRQIMEKGSKLQVPLHFNYVDFKAAFPIIWRGALWKMLRYIRVEPKVTSLIEAIYDNVECALVTNGQLTEWFRVEIGVIRLIAITHSVQFVPGVCRG